MFAGGSGAILPNKIMSKHNFRYVPNMTGPDIVAKLRKHLDKHGYNGRRDQRDRRRAVGENELRQRHRAAR